MIKLKMIELFQFNVSVKFLQFSVKSGMNLNYSSKRCRVHNY